MAASRFNVLVLGYGEMGHAMEHLLAGRHALTVWQRRPPPGTEPVDLEYAAARSDFVLFCLPAQPHFQLAQRLLPAVSANTICLSIAKGLDDHGRTPAQIFREVFGSRAMYGVLYGPMISEELRADRPGFAQLGTAGMSAFNSTRSLFGSTRLHIKHTSDITGISWAAVLKNVYTMLLGITDGLRLGDNMRGYLTVIAVHEIDRIVTRLGGVAATAYDLAGLGDLMTTATSAGSRHYETGRRFARGERIESECEGVHTLRMIRARRLFDTAGFPLFRLAEACVLDPVNIGAKVSAYVAQLAR